MQNTDMVGVPGLEPGTYCLYQLLSLLFTSLVGADGFEQSTPTLY